MMGIRMTESYPRWIIIFDSCGGFCQGAVPSVGVGNCLSNCPPQAIGVYVDEA